MNAPAPHARWFRFSLRTTFMVMTLAALLPWLAVNGYWIHERNVLLNTKTLPLKGERRAPWPLWVIGVRGFAHIDAKVPPENVAAIQEAARVGKIHYQRVFPEADVTISSNAP
jgi:hypothetical protein